MRPLQLGRDTRKGKDSRAAGMTKKSWKSKEQSLFSEEHRRWDCTSGLESERRRSYSGSTRAAGAAHCRKVRCPPGLIMVHGRRTFLGGRGGGSGAEGCSSCSGVTAAQGSGRAVTAATEDLHWLLSWTSSGQRNLCHVPMWSSLLRFLFLWILHVELG